MYHLVCIIGSKTIDEYKLLLDNIKHNINYYIKLIPSIDDF